VTNNYHNCGLQVLKETLSWISHLKDAFVHFMELVLRYLFLIRKTLRGLYFNDRLYLCARFFGRFE